jgi:hypothetical protein
MDELEAPPGFQEVERVISIGKFGTFVALAYFIDLFGTAAIYFTPIPQSLRSTLFAIAAIATGLALFVGMPIQTHRYKKNDVIYKKKLAKQAENMQPWIHDVFQKELQGVYGVEISDSYATKLWQHGQVMVKLDHITPDDYSGIVYMALTRQPWSNLYGLVWSDKPLRLYIEEKTGAIISY